ncbi:Condensation domain-containing protein [Jatrophihabitans endophyticus]|uniref:Condensation domain-containing protein n=1 Tax=Jatrophihabitans endophyticus TaxID=1206085 RepID=A0A1M5CPQ3_9ACTN|nr:condensation domain-containing protein [Jatrophihabitans endophyticus]SHF56382.1 Condensation domain-containing protein [Jatrophihabitans endophyticus]
MTDRWVLPASFAQERLYLLAHMPSARIDAYTITGRLTLQGPLDHDALRAAVADLVAQHDVLRTGLRADRSGRIEQHVWAERPFPVAIEDLRHEADPSLAAAARAAAVEGAVIDLHDGTVWRLWLGRTGPESHVLALVVHHAAADAVSMRLLLDQLAAHYRAHLGVGVAPGRPALQYADFAVWQRDTAAAGGFDDALAFWTQRLGRLAPADVPAGGTGLTLPLDIDPAALATVRSAAAHTGGTAFTVLLTAFVAGLRRAADPPGDIAVLVPVAGRDRPELEEVVGCLVDNVVIVVPSDAADLAGQVRAGWADALGHATVPFDLALRRCPPQHRAALTRTLFNLRPTLAGSHSWTPELTAGIAPEPPPPASFGLAVQLALTADGAARGHLVTAAGGVADTVARDLADRLARAEPT